MQSSSNALLQLPAPGRAIHIRADERLAHTRNLAHAHIVPNDDVARPEYGHTPALRRRGGSAAGGTQASSPGGSTPNCLRAAMTSRLSGFRHGVLGLFHR